MASEGMLANASVALSAAGAKLLMPAPDPTGAMPPKRFWTSAEIPPVTFISERSARPKAVGSRVATWLPLITNGAPPLTLTKAPVPTSPLNPLAPNVSSHATSRPVRMFTVSLPPSKMFPTMREPGRKVRESDPEKWKSIAVPPVPMMLPELMRVAPISADMPVSALIVPELVTLAASPTMPKLPAPVAEMVPELMTLAVSARMPMLFEPVAEMVPELVTLAVMASTPKLPEIVPELLMLAMLALMPTEFVPVTEMVPELVTLAVPTSIPLLPSPDAKIVPELVTLAVTASMPKLPTPVAEMVPEFVTMAVPLSTKMPSPLPPEIVPELVTFALLLASMPSWLPEMVPDAVLVTVSDVPLSRSPNCPPDRKVELVQV